MKLSLPLSKALLSVLLFVCFQISAFSQTAKDKYVIWLEEQECRATNVQLEPTDILRCDSFVHNGTSIRIIEHNGLFVGASFYEESGYLVGDIFIGNETKNRILVDPGKWVVVHAKTAESREVSNVLAIEPSVPPSKIADKIVSRMRWANVFTALGASLQTSNATSSGSVRSVDQYGNVVTGTYSAKTTSPDYAAINRARSQNADRYNEAARKAENTVSTALLPNTVFSGTQVTGLVYFKKNKKAQLMTAMLSVGDITYFFKIGRPKK